MSGTDTINEVVPGVFMFRERGGLSAIKPEVNVYILAGHDGLIFDAGYGSRAAAAGLVRQVALIGEEYRRRGTAFAITRVLPSHAHPDHFSGLHRIRKLLGCRVLLTRDLAQKIRSRSSFYHSFEADTLNDYFVIKTGLMRILGELRLRLFRAINERIYGMEFIDDPDEIIPNEHTLMINGEPWRVFPVPGHSSDHISLYNEQRGILFAGDNILRTITTWLGPPDSNLDDYMKTLERVLHLPKLEVILGAHGSPVCNPRERVSELLEYRKKRTREVIEAVKEQGDSGMTVDRLIKLLYPREGLFKRELARGWVVLTLRHLESAGYLSRRTNGAAVYFTVKERAHRPVDDDIACGTDCKEQENA